MPLEGDDVALELPVLAVVLADLELLDRERIGRAVRVHRDAREQQRQVDVLQRVRRLHHRLTGQLRRPLERLDHQLAHRPAVDDDAVGQVGVR